MGFFFTDAKVKPSTVDDVKSLAYEHECKVCSLRRVFCSSPKLEASGSTNPLLYILGESLSNEEDSKGSHFITRPEPMLQYFIKKRSVKFNHTYERRIRYNNVVRCKPPKNRAPTELEVDCCRRSIERDIEATKPKIILGLGNIPLKWFLSVPLITNWRGRFIPVKIGSHTCWFYPTFHPSYVQKKTKKSNEFRDEFEMVFERDINTVIDASLGQGNLGESNVVTTGFLDNITFVEGKSSSDLETVRKSLDRIAKYPKIGLDIETISLRPYSREAKIVTMAVGTDKDTFAFPFQHPKAWGRNYKPIKELIKNFLLKSGKKVAHNLKFELEWLLYCFGDEVLFETSWEDTMGQAYAIDERSSKVKDSNLSFNMLTLQHFGFRVKDLTHVDVMKILEYPVKDVLLYNGLDTKYEFLLHGVQENTMPTSSSPMYEQSLYTCATLARTQAHGLNPDLSRVEEFSLSLKSDLSKMVTRINDLDEVKKFENLYKEPFNPGSNDHLVKIFRDILLLPEVKKTAGNGYSTDKTVLEQFAKNGVELAVIMQKHRELAKLLSTYVESIPGLVFPDGLMHPEFSHLFTATGRLAAENPNMQNWPKRKHSYIRAIIRALKGYFLLAVDYGQIEARVIAMASFDEVFCEAIRNNYDIHMEWALRAAAIYPKSAGVGCLDELKADKKKLKDFRNVVKNLIVFPLFYGATKYSMGMSLGMPEKQSTQLYNEFWDTFKGVKKWQKGLVKFYEKYGYVETLTGRRRHGALNYNKILNTPIQGTASDIVVSAMNRLSRKSYDLGNPTYQARLNVHDDLTFMVPAETLEDDVLVIAKEMCTPTFDFINVPLAVEMSVGVNWAELEEFATFTSDDFKEEL